MPAANADFECARLDERFAAVSVACQLARYELEGHSGLLAGLQVNATIAFEMQPRDRHTGLDIADIKLHDFIPGTLTRILHLRAHGVARPRGAHA